MPQPILSSQDRRSLYSQCDDRERAILFWDLAAFKNQLVRILAFRIPSGPMLKKLLAKRPVLENARSSSRQSASRRKHEKVDGPVDAYFTLVEILKKANNNDELWLILALWLKQEAIREPEEFLPAAIYKRLTRKVRHDIQGISFTDMRYFELVQCWEPYFARLLEDCKRLRLKTADLKEELSNLG